MTILKAQTNSLASTKVLEDTMKRVENGNTIKLRVMVLIERRLVGKPGTYKILCRVREGVGLVDPYPLTQHERLSAMDTGG